MLTAIFEGCKRKNQVPRIHGFDTFATPEQPIAPSGSFRINVRTFLRECAEPVPEGFSVHGMPIWCTILAQKKRGLMVHLLTIEERTEDSSRPFCDHCRCFGWRYHFVSKRRYHLIIPVQDQWFKSVDGGILKIRNHLLHGLIHCNGYGHLICINGVEGGSKYLCGREIMDLWDRICTNLHARAITVDDVSKKKSMDLRLLHSVAFGHPWFGRWGYRYCRGILGVTEHEYEKKIENIGLQELDKIIQDCSSSINLEYIIHFYRKLSKIQLITVRDLLRFMLTFNYGGVPFYRNLTTLPATAQSTSSSPLRTIQEFSTGEYTIQEIGNDIQVDDTKPKKVPQPVVLAAPTVVAGVDLYSDVAFLYKNILLGYRPIRMDVQAILDREHLIKALPFIDQDDDLLLRYICRVTQDGTQFSPGEHIEVPLFCTIGELKEAVQAAMRDTYHVAERVEVIGIEGLVHGVEDGDILFGGIESGRQMQVEVRGIQFNSVSKELRFEGGPDSCNVNCKCGATDHDGGRMAICFLCTNWQHTRCNAIEDSALVPALFLCADCSLGRGK